MKSKLARLRLAAAIAFFFATSTSFAAVSMTYETFTLSWTAPAANLDGSPLTDLLGYYVYMGETQDSLQPVWFVAADSTTFKIRPAAAGYFYFAVSAVNADGIESAVTPWVAQRVIPR